MCLDLEFSLGGVWHVGYTKSCINGFLLPKQETDKQLLILRRVCVRIKFTNRWKLSLQRQTSQFVVVIVSDFPHQLSLKQREARLP